MELFNLFLDYLNDIGAAVVEKQPNSIVFRHHERYFMFRVEGDSDEHYFQILLPNIYDILSGSDSDIQSKIMELNMRIKAIKGLIIRSDDPTASRVWLVCEQFVYSAENIEILFSRSIGALLRYYMEFRTIVSHA